jgi:hypothetical protein
MSKSEWQRYYLSCGSMIYICKNMGVRKVRKDRWEAWDANRPGVIYHFSTLRSAKQFCEKVMGNDSM